MKTITSVIACAVFALGLSASAQNLVPNGTFEAGTAPNFDGQVSSRCNSWLGTQGSGDYKIANGNTGLGLASLGTFAQSPFFCHAVETTSGLNCGTPYEGSRVIGIYYRQGGGGSREMVQCQLSTPLVSGKMYDVEMAIKNSYTAANGGGYSDAIGALFTMGSLNGFNYELQDWSGASPNQWVKETAIFTNTSWEVKTYQFTATNNYVYMSIGCLETYVSWAWSGSDFGNSYFLLDDVSVVEVVGLAEEELELDAEVLSQNKIAISWEPSFINSESSYKLFRSIDGGKSFKEIDQVLAGHYSEFNTIDTDAGLGAVFYKVKEYSIEGRKSSAMVKVVNNGVGLKNELNVYRSEDDAVTLGFESKEGNQLSLKIVDINGRSIYTETIDCQKGINQIGVNVPTISNGIYMIYLEGYTPKKLLIK